MKNSSLQQFKHYLHSFYENGESSRTETFNMISSLVDLMLEISGIDQNLMEIKIHFSNTPEFATNQDCAFLEYYMLNNFWHFDLHLNAEFGKIENEDDLFELFSDCSHEVRHIIQFLTKYKKCMKYDSFKDNLQKLIDSCSLARCSKQNLLARKLEQHSYSLGFISELEKDADIQGEKLMHMCLSLCKENNPSFNRFLLRAHTGVANIQKQRAKLYLKHSKMDEQNLKSRTHNFNLTKKDLTV